jgi:Polysaccharide biosynthesis protein
VAQPAALGHYRYGHKMATLPSVAIIQVFSYVLLPAFSRIAHNSARFREVFLRVLGLLWSASCPLAGLIIVIGEPVTAVLLGEQWRGAGIALVAMAGLGPGVAVSAVGTEAIKGYGHSQLLNWVNLVGAAVGVGALLALLPLGLVGVGLALRRRAGMWTSHCALARSVVDVTLGDIVRQLFPSAGHAGSDGAIGFLHSLVYWSDHRQLIGGLLLLGESVGFAGVFIVVLFAVAPDQSAAMTGALRQLIRPEVRRA